LAIELGFSRKFTGSAALAEDFFTSLRGRTITAGISCTGSFQKTSPASAPAGSRFYLGLRTRWLSFCWPGWKKEGLGTAPDCGSHNSSSPNPFNLIGLPPTPEELITSPKFPGTLVHDAYGGLEFGCWPVHIDGESVGLSIGLDVVRSTPNNGFEAGLRNGPHACWRYRDYCQVEAF